MALRCRRVGAVHHIIRVVLTLRRLLPIFPDKQTSEATAGMSQTCQEQKFNRYLPYPIFARMLSLPPNRIVTKLLAMLKRHSNQFRFGQRRLCSSINGDSLI